MSKRKLFVKLKDISNIYISNIDKKINLNEVDVFLCNFIDVYRNWAITKGKSETFMRATAKKVR